MKFSPTTGGPTKVATPWVVQTWFKVIERKRIKDVFFNFNKQMKLARNGNK